MDRTDRATPPHPTSRAASGVRPRPLRATLAALVTLAVLAVTILAAFFLVILVLAATGSTSPVVGTILTLTLVLPAVAGVTAALSRAIVPRLAGSRHGVASLDHSRNLVVLTVSVATAGLVLLSSGEGPVAMVSWAVTVGGGGALGAWVATRQRPAPVAAQGR